MFQSLKAITLAIVSGIVMVSGAHADTAKWNKSSDDRATEVKAASDYYLKGRKEMDRDMVELLKSDTGGALVEREARSFVARQNENIDLETKYKPVFKNQIHFSVERAPLESLRSVGLAADLQKNDAKGYWVDSDRSPMEFSTMYGAPANTVSMGTGLCVDPASSAQMYVYNGERQFSTYVDINAEGKPVEIHVTTCRYSEGPSKGSFVILSLSPVMQAVNFTEKFATQERKVRKYSTIGMGAK